MDFVIRLGCPWQLCHQWQGWIFVAVACFLAAMGARLTQGSFLRIGGAALGAMARDGLLYLLITHGYLTPTNPSYDPLAIPILLFCAGAGGAMGATLAPYRGPFLLLMAALGCLAGQWGFGLLPLAYLIWRRKSTSSSAVAI